MRTNHSHHIGESSLNSSQIRSGVVSVEMDKTISIDFNIPEVCHFLTESDLPNLSQWQSMVDSYSIYHRNIDFNNMMKIIFFHPNEKTDTSYFNHYFFFEHGENEAFINSRCQEQQQKQFRIFLENAKLNIKAHKEAKNHSGQENSQSRLKETSDALTLKGTVAIDLSEVKEELGGIIRDYMEKHFEATYSTFVSKKDSCPQDFQDKTTPYEEIEKHIDFFLAKRLINKMDIHDLLTDCFDEDVVIDIL